MKFEICTDGAAGVRAAQEAGADRVELCASLFEGGLTPSRGAMRQARRVAGIGLHVMIRPRGGDFLPDADEFAAMLTDIATAREEGAEGVVFGCLSAEGAIDVPRTGQLIEAARPMSITFHRAFDMTADPFAALEALVSLGVDRVLTSGQAATVLDGLPLIAQLIERAGARLIVMPGGGITPQNVGRIVAAARPAELHFAALRPVASPMRYQRADVFMGGELRQPEYTVHATDATRLRQVMAAAGG